MNEVSGTNEVRSENFVGFGRFPDRIKKRTFVLFILKHHPPHRLQIVNNYVTKCTLNYSFAYGRMVSVEGENLTMKIHKKEVKKMYQFIFNVWKTVGNGCDEATHSLTMFTIIAIIGICMILTESLITFIKEKKAK